MTVRRILVTGGDGQVGRELRRAHWPSGLVPHFPDRSALDLCDSASILTCLGSGEWVGVVNCAAYTAVDAAEDDVARAFQINAQGPAVLAEAAAHRDIPIVHLSTDYVFDGTFDRPYRESDPVGPVNVYGASKLAGELAVRAANPRSVVLRTAWVLSAHRTNFLKTMLRLGSTSPRLRVVADQHGNPTAAADIAAAVMVICQQLADDAVAPCGTYHFAGAGDAAWHDVACEVFAAAGRHGQAAPVVEQITSAQFPTRAPRPANSRLDTALITRTFGIRPRHWRDAVHDIVEELCTMEQPA